MNDLDYLQSKVDKLESALASERAKTAAETNRADAAYEVGYDDAVQKITDWSELRMEAADRGVRIRETVIDQVRTVLASMHAWELTAHAEPTISEMQDMYLIRDRFDTVLAAAPTVAFDAALTEARAGSLEEAKAIVTRVCRDDLEDYYGQIRVEVGRALDARAAEIREAQK